MVLHVFILAFGELSPGISFMIHRSLLLHLSYLFGGLTGNMPMSQSTGLCFDDSLLLSVQKSCPHPKVFESRTP